VSGKGSGYNNKKEVPMAKRKRGIDTTVTGVRKPEMSALLKRKRKEAGYRTCADLAAAKGSQITVQYLYKFESAYRVPTWRTREWLEVMRIYNLTREEVLAVDSRPETVQLLQNLDPIETLVNHQREEYFHIKAEHLEMLKRIAAALGKPVDLSVAIVILKVLIGDLGNGHITVDDIDFLIGVLAGFKQPMTIPMMIQLLEARRPVPSV
jgi:hypothetical protein